MRPTLQLPCLELQAIAVTDKRFASTDTAQFKERQCSVPAMSATHLSDGLPV